MLMFWLYLVGGILGFLGSTVPNVWIVWEKFGLVNFPYEALSEYYLDSDLTIGCAIFGPTFLLLAAGWKLADDSFSEVLASLGQLLGLAAYFTMDSNKENFNFFFQGMLLTSAIVTFLQMASGSSSGVVNKKSAKGGIFSGSFIKAITIVLVALLFFSTLNGQPTCFASLPTTSKINLEVKASFSLAFGKADEFTLEGNEKGLVKLRKGSEVVFSSVTTSKDPEAFVVGALAGSLTAVNDHEMGLYDIVDAPGERSYLQTVEDSGKSSSTDAFLSGKLHFPSGKVASYIFEVKAADPKQVSFRLTISPINGEEATRVYFVHSSSMEERIFGTGFQYSFFDLKGGCVPIFTQEQGIGRGLQPLSYIINLAVKGAPGTWQTSYAPSAHYLTSKLRSLYLVSTEFAVFDFSRPDRIAIESNSSSVEGSFLVSSNPLEAIEKYTEVHAGRMRAVPDWAGAGAIVGLQGGTEMVEEKVKVLQDAGVPLAGLWLQDWTGKRETTFGRRLQWNWELNSDFYPGWNELVQKLAKQKIYMLTYINPYLANTGISITLFEEAKRVGCLLMTPDGSEVLIQASATPEFTFGTVDLMDPTCMKWYMEEVIRKRMIGEKTTSFDEIHGALGFMSDFAEGISMDCTSKTGPGHSFHNEFPVRWSEACREAAKMNKFTEENVLFWSRSGGGRSPGYTTLQWTGDQLTSWDDRDGMQTALIGILSGGISGYSLSHSDIGGYTMISKFGIIKYLRSAEMFIRWCEMNVFSDVVFRTHEGLLPDESAQAYTEVIAPKFAKFSKLHSKLFFALKKPLMQDAVNKGWPLARAMFLHYADDPNVYTPEIKKQFLLGENVLVCPVFAPNVNSVRCYVPKGEWTHVFTGESFGQNGGSWINCAAPLGKPCVLVLPEAKSIGEIIRAELA